VSLFRSSGGLLHELPPDEFNQITVTKDGIYSSYSMAIPLPEGSLIEPAEPDKAA